MSGKKHVSVFANGQVFIAVDAIYKMLGTPAFIGAEPVEIIMALDKTVKFIEQQTIKSISNEMFDRLDEE